MNMDKNELMVKQIKEFEERTMFKLEVKDGKLYYKGTLCCTSDYLPDNLVVDGGLRCFEGSEKLPKDLKVKKWLDISATNITEIPNDCEFDSLYMEDTKITKLRDNLELDELRAYNSSLRHLPKGLKVKGALSISNTDIAEIPDDCEFGSLFSQDSKLTKLPNNLALNYFSACSSSLTELPKGLKVKNNLEISFTKITEIPDDCEFSSLCMMQTKITKLRDNLTLNDLHASYSALQELPKNLVVLGILTVLDTDICAIPNDCLAQEIYCNFELNDKRYEKVSEGYYKLKDKIIHISHPSGRDFLHTDRVLLEVIEKNGDVYHVRKGVNEPITYAVTDGNNHWVHGDTLEEAKEQFNIKINK